MPVSDEVAGDDESVISVLRDSSFFRAVADKAIVFDLGRDIELAFLQLGPMVLRHRRQIDEDSGQEGFDLENTVSEVCRIRTSPQCASTLAMLILNELAQANKLSKEKLLSAIDDIFSENGQDD